MSNTKHTKNNILVSLSNSTRIVDTFSWQEGIHFVSQNKWEWPEVLKNISLNNTSHTTLKTDSSFLSTWSLLLPTGFETHGGHQKLIDEVIDFIHTYVDVDYEFYYIAAYYVLMTYFYNHFSEIPYLRVIWDYGSGKSRLLKTVWNICYLPMVTNWWTSVPAIFRMTHSVQWTLVIDEADFIQTWISSDITKLLNNWYAKDSPVMRADKQGFEVSCYKVFGPKLIGWRMEFKDKALESRCISTVMRRSERMDIPSNLWDEFHTRAQSIRNKLMNYRYENYFMHVPINERIPGLEPRLNQIINPLLSMIEKDDTDMKDLVIEYLKWKQDDIKLERQNSMLWEVLNIIQRHWRSGNSEVTYRYILDTLEIDDLKATMNPRKLWSLLKQNLIVWKRKNAWTVVDIHENSKELERLYKEYWFTTHSEWSEAI